MSGSRSVSCFTAVSDCPQCGHIDVHWLDQPAKTTSADWAKYRKAKALFDPRRQQRSRSGCYVGWAGDSFNPNQNTAVAALR